MDVTCTLMRTLCRLAILSARPFALLLTLAVTLAGLNFAAPAGSAAVQAAACRGASAGSGEVAAR